MTIRGQQTLNLVENLTPDQGLVFADMPLAIMHDLTDVDRVLEQVVECAAAEWLAAPFLP
jgi:hypothetical protein